MKTNPATNNQSKRPQNAHAHSLHTPSKMRWSLAPLLLAGMSLAAAGRAQTYTWNFDSPSGSVAASHVYKDTTNTYAITAYGYKTTDAPAAGITLGQSWAAGTITTDNLYGKHTSGDLAETGLGLTDDGDHEIYSKSFVQLDVTDLQNKGLKNLTMFVSSIQQNEGYYLWGSNAQGTPGILLKSYVNTSGAAGTETQSFVVPDYSGSPTYHFFSVSATNNNVLIRNGLNATTPEPGVYALCASLGLSGAGFLARRKQRRRAV